MNTKLFRSAVAAAAVILCSVGLVSAGTEIFDNTVDTCTGINCSSLLIPGSFLNHFGVSPKPWVAQLFKGDSQVTGEHDCMRLDVVAQDADLEIVAIAPDGTVYRNDDRAGANDRRPLVIIPAGTQHGWHTVHVGVFDGGQATPVSAAVEGNFLLLYGRYNANNPNCASPTIPSALAAEEENEK